MKKYKNCLIIGKFMPPHKGHEYMIRFAKEFSEQVHVVVDCVKGQTIDPLIRKQWLEEEICNIKVYALQNFMPQEPSETPDFWNIWKTTLFKVLATNSIKPDLVVAAMDYGYKLAEVMECDFIPIDISRESFPISATMIRENVYKNWDFLLNSAKPHFIKKLCLVGPESAGKSTLGKLLAQELNTIYVPEYAKSIIEKQDGKFHLNNVPQFIEAQINTEKALAKFANKIMICDSCAITTQIYANLCFEGNFNWIDELIINHKYDHFLLFSPDVSFVNDSHREILENPDSQRNYIFNLFKEKLEYFSFPYFVISGNYENRRIQALNIVKQLIYQD